jgi:hypothetical protein
MVVPGNILIENEKRNALLFSPYDPELGIGSPIERFPLPVTDSMTLYLPKSMKDDELIASILVMGSVEKAVGKKDENLLQNILYILEEINQKRLDHDFEYWCAVAVKIQDKESKQLVPFQLRKPQLKILKALEDMRITGIPMRVILVKARQFGGSTFLQIYMAWLQIRLFTNWHSAICADVESQSRNIRGMFSRLAKNYPADFGTITLTPYEGSSKVRVVAERGNIIGVGSMQEPDSLRSFDFSMLHLSEVGLWKKTEGKSPEDLVQTLRSTVPSIPNTMIAVESTAKGVGNFFHREWLSAINGESGYAPVFVAWQEISIYWKPIDNIELFINKMTEYQWFQWEQGATLEGINWYQNFKQSENYDDWRMQSEYPTTWQESFQSTGRRAFAPIYVSKARKTCRPPELIGDLFADAIKGPDCLKNIRFEETKNGPLWLWALPDPTPMENRYALFADIGGRSLNADKSVIRGIDRAWMLDGGRPEFFLTYRSNLDQDLFAWKAAQIAKWCQNALLAIESNSLKKDNIEDEGDHYFTILDEIVDYYPNLFARTDPDSIRLGIPAKYGFHTNSKTKPMIIDRHNAAMRDDEYVETDQRACDEADTYEIKPNGSYGAVEGCHDDIEICTAGDLWVALSYMDPVREIVQKDKPNRRFKRTEASL